MYYNVLSSLRRQDSVQGGATQPRQEGEGEEFSSIKTWATGLGEEKPLSWEQGKTNHTQLTSLAKWRSEQTRELYATIHGDPDLRMIWVCMLFQFGVVVVRAVVYLPEAAVFLGEPTHFPILIPQPSFL